MSLSRLKAALDGGPPEEVLAAIAALDDKERQAVLGRARVSSYGISATNAELGYFADEAAILLALLLPSHPKAAAIRASATQLRVWRRRGAPLPLPLQRVAEAAWGDEAHVTASRALYQQKFDLADRIFAGMQGYSSPEAASSCGCLCRRPSPMARRRR